VTRLTVFYDARCGLCCAVRSWLSRQPQLIPLDCRPKSARGRGERPFDSLRSLRVVPSEVDGREQGEKPAMDADELVVVADSGEVWSGDSAWLMVLWALTEYRQWSYRLASPLLLPTARTLFATLSEYRGSLSCRLGLKPEVD
jgi:predicted DCC family thiol-disulfide oxidoreductase YuxK